jgi:hypothetical protein
MRNSSYFWGIILVLIGVLFLISNFGWLVGINLWNLVWPLFFIGLGFWILWGVFVHRSTSEEYKAIAIEGAARAQVRINHGAGRLEVRGGAGNSNLLEGTFSGGLVSTTQRVGDLLDVRMSTPSRYIPFWFPTSGLNWSFSFNKDILLALDFQTGADEARIDLTDLQVTDLRFHSGASSSDISLPAHAGVTRVEVEIGLASLNILVPDGVAARIHTRGGLSSTSINRQRFPRIGDFYQSPDYDSAENKVEIRAEVGVGSVTIR